jgi:5-hydroxyisourate hydrolase-like protein (transthyretin family)
MKNNKIRNSITLLLCFVFIAFSNILVNAQTKKQKARVSVTFNKEGKLNFLKISGKYKEGKKYNPAEGLDVDIYQVFENDSLVLLTNVTLNKKGVATVDVTKVLQNNLEQYNFNVTHKASKKFKKVTKKISFQVADLNASLQTKDEKHFIVAKLTNTNNEPIEDAELKVQLQRLFSPLAVGKGIYFTDENGMINVPITEIMPGVKGKLNYEVILEDSDDYGTIIKVIETSIGKPIVDQSTFDERTMWSPPTKAPWFNLIIPNILIVGIWGYLVILVFNLYRISKHKNS